MSCLVSVCGVCGKKSSFESRFCFLNNNNNNNKEQTNLPHMYISFPLLSFAFLSSPFLAFLILSSASSNVGDLARVRVRDAAPS